MIIFCGRRKIRIKKYDDYLIKCGNCNSYGQRFSVYQEYFHVFFIPIFPFGSKTIKTTCTECNDTFNDEKVNHYLSITRTPIYLYLGVILFVGLIISLVIGNITSQNKKAEYIADPKVNDVYLIRQDETNQTIYYFLKIKSITSDTVELLHSSLQYDRFVSRMNDSDYFVIDEIYKVPKSDLSFFLEEGMINMVVRDYDKSSRFMIEN